MKLIFSRPFAVVILFLLSFSVQAALSGNDLLETCEGKGEFAGIGSSTSEMACSMLIFGFIEGINTAAAIASINRGEAHANKLICLSTGVTPDQLRRMISKAGDERPEILSNNIGNLLFPVLIKAWPCKTEASTPP